MQLFSTCLQLHVYGVVNGMVNTKSINLSQSRTEFLNKFSRGIYIAHEMYSRLHSKTMGSGMREKTYHVQSYPITTTPRLGTRGKTQLILVRQNTVPPATF